MARTAWQLQATDVPRVRDWIVRELIPADIEAATQVPMEDVAERAVAEFGPRLGAQMLRGASLGLAIAGALEEGASLDSDDAHLWWVAPRMAGLAAEAAPQMPAWTPAAARPSRHGVVAWCGGAGLMSRAGHEIVGASWQSRPDGGLLLTPITAGGDGPMGTDYLRREAAAWQGDWSLDPTGLGARLWALLGATWLLAQSPTVGAVHNVRFNRRDPDRPFAPPMLPGTITRVTLRKADYGAPQIDGQSRPGPTHQFIVRGHWRQQACGPKREWRKPVYIAPYVKGPDGTPLLTRPTVHVWKR